MKLPRIRVVVRYRAARGRMSRFMTGSVAVHGLVLAAAMILPMTRHRAAPIEDSMVVALAGPIGGPPPARGVASAAPAAKSTAPKIEAPKPAPKEAHTVREVPVPKPKDKTPKPKEKPAPTKDADETQPSTAKPSGAASPNPGTPQGPGAAPAPGAGAVTATVGGGDSSLGWYGASVKAALESAWIKPYLEDAEGTASVVVAFDIARDGQTRNLRVVQSSGIPSLDRSAQRAVIEASPLPAIPPSWTEDTIPVTMRFDLTPETR